MNNYRKVGIIGGGAWGLAVASLQNSSKVILFSRNNIENLPKNVSFITNNFEYLSDLDCIFITTPSCFFKNTILEIKNYSSNNPDIVICTKGFSQDDVFLLSDLVALHYPKSQIGILSGPNFASEVMEKMPTSSLLASKSKELFLKAKSSMDYIKLHYSTDIIGAQICGAIKNVFAIASGMLKGMGFRENTHCAMITKALLEMGDIVEMFGGERETTFSLAGIGDLMLTCNSLVSRNTSFGYDVVKYGCITKALTGKTVEGYNTSLLLREKNTHSQIIKAIYKILFEDAPTDILLQAIF
ncbi:NAD(P)-dependent glycerol-3-phosphate dehydrogenase [Candidatus Cyrtobacter comes]|uniref:Glycerol-3-phosphate dehydrogenase n=1 Tax=Candidatus Cyrtobacter comes TaxID=675776 RepID=A0ABU5L904_9RICK|nr:NAD(P)H-dependent glycerol-3-phosphate dehydrogenase [Candidatus Cyrtobacter comes]MDZ5762604.1 NAD(P)-dependent glycerol-3-phosphate dehydrogenase [Candidatus Cyrtobacter comes]